jgi:primase-polymerase (primpol)-like protein
MFVMLAGSFERTVLDLCLRVAIHSAGSILTIAGPETVRSRRKRRRLSTDLQAMRRYRPRVPGVHILVRAKLHGSGRRTGKLELYDSGRYFTITGQPLLRSSVGIENRQSQVEKLLCEVFTSEMITPMIAYPTILFTSDEKLIERAKLAKNGDRFARLWNGDTSDFGGDHSRADLALCRMLSFWCKGDIERVDRLFRQSGLMRDKWDRPCGAMRYGERTLATLSLQAR